MSNVAIRALGPLKVDGAHVGAVPKKSKALLVYLAMQPDRTATRAKLADLLWPYQQSEQARHSLRNCLLELKKAIGTEAFLATVDSVSLADDVQFDVELFRTLARSDRTDDLQSAIDLHRGEFLSEFYLTSEPFEEWVSGEREQLNLTSIDVLSRFSVASSVVSDHVSAVSAARRAITIDPLAERSHRLLMNALHAAGRRSEALNHFKSCAAMLKQELGVSPDAATARLVETISTRVDVKVPTSVTILEDGQRDRVMDHHKRRILELQEEVYEWKLKYTRLLNSIRVVKSAVAESRPTESKVKV